MKKLEVKPKGETETFSRDEQKLQKILWEQFKNVLLGRPTRICQTTEIKTGERYGK